MGQFIEEHARARQPPGVRRRRRSPASSPDRDVGRGRGLPVPARRRVVEPPRDRPLRRLGRRARVRQLDVGRGAVRARHELPGSLPPHAHLADVHRRGIRRRRTSARSASGIAERIGRYREDYAAYYKAFAEPASPALRDSNPSVVVIPGLGPVRLRQGQARGAHHDRVLRQRHPRDAGGERARRGTRAPAAVRCRRCGARSRRRSSRPSTTTSRCRASRRSASNTGRSKKPSCSGCRRRRSSAARSSSSSAAAAASAGKSRCRSRSAAGTSSSPTRTATAAAEAAQEAADAVVEGDGAVGDARPDVARHDRGGGPRGGAAVRRLRLVVNTAAIYPTPDPSDAAGRRRGRKTLQHQRDVELRAGAGSGEGAARRRSCRRRSCSPARPTRWCRRRAARPTTSARRPSTTWCASWRSASARWCASTAIAPATVIAGSSMFPRDRVIVSLKKYNIAVRGVGVDGGAAQQAGGVLRAADDHAPADPADRQRQRDLLPRRRPEREDHRPRHSGRWRAAGGVSAVDAVNSRLPTPRTHDSSRNSKLQTLKVSVSLGSFGDWRVGR